jgi:superfamily II DNA helicase RecQ
MYVSESDFDKYKSDFYLGGLRGPAKDAVLASIDALKSFSLDTSTCRRRALLDFFQEVPSFGKRCGTCDTCRKLATYNENDLERDFGPISRVILQTVDALNEQSAGTIVEVIAGKVVDGYRYKRGVPPSTVKESVLSRKNEVKQRVTQESYREFLVPLVQRGFLSEATKTTNVNGFSVSGT